MVVGKKVEGRVCLFFAGSLLVSCLQFYCFLSLSLASWIRKLWVIALFTRWVYKKCMPGLWGSTEVEHQKKIQSRDNYVSELKNSLRILLSAQ